jgi:oligopeptidase A
VTDPVELDGLSDETRRAASTAAVDDGHVDATPGAGPWLLTLNPSVYSAVMTRAKNARLREKLWKAERTVASSGSRDNRPVMTKILQLRSEMASLLGFSSWAELRAQSRVRHKG